MQSNCNATTVQLDQPTGSTGCLKPQPKHHCGGDPAAATSWQNCADSRWRFGSPAAAAAPLLLVPLLALLLPLGCPAAVVPAGAGRAGLPQEALNSWATAAAVSNGSFRAASHRSTVHRRRHSSAVAQTAVQAKFSSPHLPLPAPTCQGAGAGHGVGVAGARGGGVQLLAGVLLVRHQGHGSVHKHPLGICRGGGEGRQAGNRGRLQHLCSATTTESVGSWLPCGRTPSSSPTCVCRAAVALGGAAHLVHQRGGDLRGAAGRRGRNATAVV